MRRPLVCLGTLCALLLAAPHTTLAEEPASQASGIGISGLEVAQSNLEGRWHTAADDRSHTYTFREGGRVDMERTWQDEVMYSAADWALETTDFGAYVLVLTQMGDDGMPLSPDRYTLMFDGDDAFVMTPEGSGDGLRFTRVP